MSLAGRLRELEDVHTQPNFCKVFKIMQEMDEPTRSALESILKSKVSNTIITKELRNHGIDVGKTTISTHRSKRCSCWGVQ